MLGPDNAIWDDGEWVGWGEIDRQIHYKEWVQNIPMPNVGRANTRSFNLLKKPSSLCAIHHMRPM